MVFGGGSTGSFFLNAFFLLAIKVGGIHRLWKALVGTFTGVQVLGFGV